MEYLDTPNKKEIIEKLNSLDFSPLAYKLMHPEDRPGLSINQAVDAIKKYKGFLFIYCINRDRTVSPSRYIDYVWHTHILDTELYLIQSLTLFNHYLHHFPFFGKKDDAAKRDLLAAAEFTKEQAFHHFQWSEDEWCGISPKSKSPEQQSADLINLINTINPTTSPFNKASQNQDTVTIQTGNFRHTIEHLDLQSDSLLSWRSSQLDRASQILKLPPWVIVCMPAELNLLKDIITIQNKEKLLEASKILLEKRLAPEGFSGELVHLQIK